MKIGVILYPYGDKQPAGLTETILSLSLALSKLETEHTFVFFVKGEEPEVPAFLAGTKHELRRAKKVTFWLDDAVKQGADIDVWVFNTPMMPFFRKTPKSIVIALDFAFLHYPSKNLKSYLHERLIELLQGRALKRATHIVSISEFTKREVTRWFPSIKPGKVTTIMAGYRDLHAISPEPISVALPQKYLLSIGIIKYRKNQLNIVKGFFLAKERGLKEDLVISGRGTGEYMDEIYKTVEVSPYKNHVIFTGYVAGGQVVTAYQGATAVVFPSRMEGFGFPVLEAMSLGVPVITANTNSVVEVAGNAAITVDPESPEAIADAMIEMSNPETQQRYRELGHLRLNDFSWEDTAQKLVVVAEKITRE